MFVGDHVTILLLLIVFHIKTQGIKTIRVGEHQIYRQ